MGFWNYRVVCRRTDSNGKPLERPELAIYEAFYEEGERDKAAPQPHTITADPVAAMAYDVEGLRHEFFEIMAHAFDSPVLEWEEIGSSDEERKE